MLLKVQTYQEDISFKIPVLTTGNILQLNLTKKEPDLDAVPTTPLPSHNQKIGKDPRFLLLGLY